MRALLFTWLVLAVPGGAAPGPEVVTLRTADGMTLNADWVPGEKIHGTRMFGKVEGIEARIAAWTESTLGRVFEFRIPWASFEAVGGQRYRVLIRAMGHTVGGPGNEKEVEVPAW